MNHAGSTRILIVDDTTAIHADFAKILTPAAASPTLAELERLAFGESAPAAPATARYTLDFALQGEQALEMVRAAARSDQHYALAFVDMRMPPGWDGLQTTERLWEVDPDLQIVICSAYSSHDWEDVMGRLRYPDKLLVIKKPFEAIEVLQCANAMTRKWHGERELRRHLLALEQTVAARTASLESANKAMLEQMRLRQAVELELSLAQKLEAVGRLAAGIAHEINTPVQYISDSVHFLKSAFEEILVSSGPAHPGTGAADSDLDFLREEIPRAIERTLEGAERVATIVRAMKEFAHPDGAEKVLSDINRAIETTLMIARSEYKYVATASFSAGNIPEIYCNVGELSQVFLNLIVNAAHALGDAGRNADTGLISISTQLDGDWVVLSFNDNGCGIPQENLDKIYDPFFTTKEVGRGTGQGLAIARSIVVDKHGGRMSATSSPGAGTCFKVWLPTPSVGRRAA